MSTETGAIKLDKQSYNNGHLEYHAALGETTVIIVSAQKYKFLKSKGCQYESPNVLLLEKITKRIPEKCAYPCHWNTSKWSLGKTMNKIIAHLPVCRNIEEENCILDVAIEVQNLPSNIYMKTVH